MSCAASRASEEPVEPAEPAMRLSIRWDLPVNDPDYSVVPRTLLAASQSRLTNLAQISLDG
jgi:hypothetical protein